ncbi:ABC transporter ATP-binding protein [Candidatus Saccharibacteria bacterium]|nr:ABC transporter ATP-binding protein [Candidatus Saccharibacteria bacterium]
MLKLFKYLKPYWWQVILLVVTMGTQTYLTLQLPALMADIVNNGIANGNSDYILQIGLKMLGFTVAASLFALVTHYFSAKVGAAFTRDLRRDFYKKVISFSVTEIDNFSTASLITRTTNDIDQVSNAIMMMLTMLLRAPMMGLGAIFQAIQTAPDLTWTIALGIGVIIFFTVIIMAAVIPKFKLFQKLIDHLVLVTRENLTGLRVVRAFNKEAYEQQKFAKTNHEITKTALFFDRLMSLQDPLINLTFDGITLLVVWLSLHRLEADITYLGDMMAFVQYASHVLIAFLILTMLFVILPRANVSAGRLQEVFKTKNKITWKDQTEGVPERTPSVEFKNVSFLYAGAEENVLSNVSFKANAGETTAFIGSTGSGKSTLISLVPRFYEATSGEVLIDGLNIKDYSVEDLMKRIGYVPQKGVLFAGTVKNNIAFGTPNAKDADLHAAARVSQSYDFIEKLDQKFNAHIAQGGTNVSGGQKQRLSIARAVAKKPEIYIFDDSFSALDMKTDKRLREALKPETKNSVVLIVAQRINTIKDADQIVVLDQGKIVGTGKHHELLKNCKVYREIVKSQFSEAEFKQELAHA